MKPDDNLLHKQRNSKSSLTEELAKAVQQFAILNLGSWVK